MADSFQNSESRKLFEIKQDSFKSGTWNDGPADGIPADGVRTLENMVNRETRLDTRLGNKRYSDLTLPAIVGRTGYNSTGTVTGDGTRILTKTAGQNFTADDVGKWYVHGDGTRERIIAFSTANIVTLRSKDGVTGTITTSDNSAYVSGQVNCIYYHKVKRKIILHIGNSIYVGDVSLTSWTQAFGTAYVNSIVQSGPQDAKSVGTELKNYFILFNSGGIFRLDLDTVPLLYYKMNSEIPTVLISDSGAQSSGTPYGRRYLYTGVVLSGKGDRDRTTPGVRLIQETGSTQLAIQGDSVVDYGEVWTANSIDSTNTSLVQTLTLPTHAIDDTVYQFQYTHYGLWATLDIGDFGYDPLDSTKQNSRVLYFWVDDVPVCSCFLAGRSGTTVTATSGRFTADMVGCTIDFVDGSTDTIASFTSSTSVETTGTGTISSQGCSIGNASNMTASQSVSGSESVGSATVTRTAGATFSVTDVGKRIYWATESVSHIVRFVDADNVEVAESEVIASTGAAFGPTSRKYTDSTTDTQLRYRSAAEEYILQTRRLEPIPLCNGGVITNGFLFGIIRGYSTMYYGQIIDNFEYHMGMHNPGSQVIDFNDGVVDAKVYPQTLIVRCKKSTKEVPTNVAKQIVNSEVGTVTSILTAKNTLSHAVGAADYSGSAWTDEQSEILVTQEPAIRFFSGRAYSDTNYAEERWQDNINELQPAYAVEWHPDIGFIIYGSNSQT